MVRASWRNVNFVRRRRGWRVYILWFSLVISGIYIPVRWVYLVRKQSAFFLVKQTVHIYVTSVLRERGLFILIFESIGFRIATGE